MILYQYAFAPTESPIPDGELAAEQEIQVLASDLTVPWDVAQLPGGDLLVTERAGELLRILANGEIQRVEVPQVAPAGDDQLIAIPLSVLKGEGQGVLE